MKLFFQTYLRAAFFLLLVASAITVSSTAMAQTTVLSLDGGKFQYKSTGSLSGVGWLLASNGYIENSLSFPYSGTYQFQVQAYGSYAAGAWPRMEVRVDQKVLSVVSVNSSTAKMFYLNLTAGSGVHKIELAFTNDYYASGQDRNLWVNHLNVITQATSTTTTSTTTTTAPSTVTWTRCATEGGVCSFSGTRQVRYGVNGFYVYQTATSTINCDNTTFGDPAVGYDKYCDYSSVVQTTTSTTLATTTTTTTTTVPVTTTTTTLPTSSTSGTVGPTISTFKASGPITLVSGQVVTGLAISNPNGPCIYGNGVSNIHIYNNKIGPCGPNTNDAAVQITGGHDITVDHNAIDDIVAGFFANSSSNNLVFDHNYVTRIKNAYPRAQMVQIAQTTGSGIRITCNISDQPTPGYLGGPEDQINMYKTYGTAASPILIKNNKLRGGGPSRSGGGILAGDESSSYITIDSNILVNPGQYGIAIAGGHDNKIINNKVYSDYFSWSNVGVFVWNQYAAACYGNTVSGNRVNWTDQNYRQTPWWDGANCGTINMSNNLFPDLSLNPTTMWSETFPDCN